MITCLTALKLEHEYFLHLDSSGSVGSAGPQAPWDWDWSCTSSSPRSSGVQDLVKILGLSTSTIMGASS